MNSLSRGNHTSRLGFVWDLLCGSKMSCEDSFARGVFYIRLCIAVVIALQRYIYLGE